MKISFLPIRSDDQLSLERQDSVLTINGEAFDFTDIPDGATLPREAVACEWLAGDITREDGVICLTLLLPHGASAPETALFPETLELGENGAVELPGRAPMEATQ